MFGAGFGGIAGFSERKRETGGSEMSNSGILRDRTRNGEMAGRRNAGFPKKRRDKRGAVSRCQVVEFARGGGLRGGDGRTGIWGMTILQIPRNSWGSFLGICGILGFSQAERMFGAESGEIAGFSESKRETGGTEMPNSGIL